MTYFIGNNLIEYEGIQSSTMEECVAYLREQTVIGLDIETSRLYPKGKYYEEVYRPGLDPYMSRIIMIQIGTLEKRFVIDARVVDYSLLKEILQNENILKVGHNLQFEGKFFLQHLKSPIFNVWDCMIVEKLLYNGYLRSYSLATLMKDYLGIKSVVESNLFENNNSQIEDLVNKLEEQYFFLGKKVDKDDLYNEAIESLEEQETVDKSIRKGFVNMKDEPFTLEQLRYGDLDITAPLRIYELQKKGRYVTDWVDSQEIEDHFYPHVGIKLENKFTQVLAEISWRGLSFDPQKWLELYESNFKLWLEKKDFLDQYVIKNHPKFTGSVDLFNAQLSCAVDWNSPAEVTKFFRSLGLAVQEFSKQTKKLAWTVGAKSLLRTLSNSYKEKFFKHDFPEEIVTGEDLVLSYLLYKKTGQLCTAFGKSWLRYVHPITGRVHSNYQQILNTTRMSSTGPNLQNLPSTEEFRSCFIAEKGWKNINCDYSGQEIRILAEVSGVELLQDFFIKEHPIFGSDFHSFTGTQLFRVVYNNPDLIINKKDHADERSTAKSLTFSLSYGASYKSVARDMGISEEEGEKFVLGYFKGFPGLKEDFEKTQKLALKRGWIRIDDYTDRRYFFPHFERMNELSKKALSYYPKDYRTYSAEQKAEFKDNLYLDHPEVKDLWREWSMLKGTMERRSLNYRIQGMGAGQTKLAAILIYNYRWKNGIQEEFYLDNLVHDEINSKSIEEKAEFYSQKIEEFMIKAGSYFCKTVPMGAESKVGDYWYH